MIMIMIVIMIVIMIMIMKMIAIMMMIAIMIMIMITIMMMMTKTKTMMMILSNLTFSLKCDVKCQTEGRVHTGCDCYKKICRSTIVPQCRPPKPSVDERCVYPPVKTFRDGVFSYEESTDSCIQCFRWEIMRKPQVNIDECPEALRKLPNQCISNYNVPGDQGFCKHIFICICY